MDSHAGSVPTEPLPAGFAGELLLSRDEVARVLRVPPDTVANLHRVGTLPGVKIGRHLRWPAAVVRAFAEALAGGEGKGAP